MTNIGCSCGCKSSAEEHRMIACSICKKPYIHSCVDFTASEIRTLHKKGTSWTCRSCHSLGSDIKELQAAILSLRNDILAQKNAASVDDALFEELLWEMKERSDRGQNIILFNVQESELRDVGARNAADLEIVTDILGSLPISIETEHIEVNRLGRFVQGAERLRPVKVRLSGVKAVHTVIKSAGHLRTSSDFKDVRIALDRTKRQMEYYRKIRQEMDARLADGASDLRIKYRRGIPVIESLN